MIHPERIQPLNKQKLQPGKYIVYWMQASQRILDNHAYAYAVHLANNYKKPLLVFFGLTNKFPEANLRHYTFMLEGLKEIAATLQTHQVPLILQLVSPEHGAARIAQDACLMVVDRGYLRIQREWRTYVAHHINCPLLQVETDVVVPVEQASPKEEYAAATFRPKIKQKISHFLSPLHKEPLKHTPSNPSIESIDIKNINTILHQLNLDTTIQKTNAFKGGTSQALNHLTQFIKHHLSHFKEQRNDPTKNICSHLSPYLHFGHISPLTIALHLSPKHDPNTTAFLEELIVRRELSMNYMYYNQNYDSFNGLPLWAQQTLQKHTKDQRPYTYTLHQLEHAETHDPYWNAAQQEMVNTGKMHGYMRMYWGKKIIEWTPKPETAYTYALYLNNKYELDGRDPNGFTGIAWCFGKHDRPWRERPIFGKIRYMNDKGLERKFDMQNYIKKINQLNIE